ncbi:MAG: AraC family transcriptional regulator [Rhizorhabdus sp.]|nr:AraC family transcriptional regulator [Rhizorhabdus sp.]
MVATSLLFKPTVSESFDCRVRGAIKTTQATIELHDYRFHGPQDADFEPRFGFLDLALSPRPGDPRGRYLDAPQAGPQLMGDIIFIPAGSRLRSQWGGGAQRSVCLEFASSRESDGWSLAELEASLDVRSPFVREAMLRLAREIEEPGFESALMAEAICVQLGIDLGRYFRASRSIEPATGRLGAAQLKRIEEMLEASGPRPSVADLARECRVSTRHFFRVFRQTTGMTLSEYAVERRIARARTLLAERRQPIKQISWACGFESAAAFSAAFRRATGFRPREFQRMLTN